MAQFIPLQTSDGQDFKAFLAEPAAEKSNGKGLILLAAQVRHQPL